MKRKVEIYPLDTTLPNEVNVRTASVKLFQARNVDSEGNPPKQDGKVGPLTWAALFGVEWLLDWRDGKKVVQENGLHYLWSL